MQLSAGIAVTRCISGTYHYLLVRSYRYWDFPKGEVEPGEFPFSAAQREVHEEAGLDKLDFIWGDGYFETKPYGRSKIARYYVALSPAGEVKLGVNPALGMPEHHEHRWVDYPAAITLLGPRVREVLEWAHRLVGDNC